MAQLKYWLWLANLPKLNNQMKLALLEHFGEPDKIYYGEKEEYFLVPGMNRTAAEILENKDLERADRILGDCDRLGIRLLTLQDATYPERLKAIHQPPMVLYWKGRQFAFDEEVAIAMVGARKATPYGVDTASRLAGELSRRGALIVSGMAEGIDATVVRGALKAGGPVVSVIAGGLDRIYPAFHRELYEDVAAVGAMFSEYPPGTEHRGSHFPIRNRILSGLSVGVIAVESARASGTLLTIGHALDQDREVFAVPGPIGAPMSEGTNRLIQTGSAKLIMSADDVLCEFEQRFPGKLLRADPLAPGAAEQRLSGGGERPPADRPKAPAEREKKAASGEKVEYLRWADCKDRLTDDQRELLLAMDGGAFRVDDLVERTQIPVRRVLSALTLLEVDGYVSGEGGKRFQAAVKLKME